MSDRRHHPDTLDADTDTITVVRDLSDETADPDLHRITWLAAYTVGLSFSPADDRACIEDLMDVGARTSELRGAHGMLSAWDMVDAARHRRAMNLIERVLSRSRTDAPSSPPQREHLWVTEWSQ